MFWQYGYDNTSLSMLVEATGLNKPSLYSEFVSKENLFKEATEMYVANFTKAVAPAIGKEKLTDAIQAFFLNALEFATADGTHRGCLAVHGAITSNAESDVAQKILLQVRKELEKILYNRILQAVKENDFPKNLDPRIYAKYLASMHSGINIQVIGASKKEDLQKVIELALIPLRN